MYGPATLADISLRIRFTCLRERRRTHHKAPSNPAAWRYCWFSVIAGKPGNAQTFIPGISYNPHRILEGWGVWVSGHRRLASSSEHCETAGKRSDFFLAEFLYAGLGLRPGP